MKKPTALVLAVLLLLSACTAKEEPKNSPSSTPEQTPVSEPASPDPTSKPTSEPIQDVSSKSIASFIQFKNEILNAGYSIDEEVRMGAELIGAVEGYKYKTSVGNIEIYQFDKTSDAYKSGIESNTVSLEGYGNVPATFNSEGFAITGLDIPEELSNFFN